MTLRYPKTAAARREAFSRFGVRQLLTPFENVPKTREDAFGCVGGILYLAPSDIAIPGRSVCPWATPGCRAGCLNTSGRGQMRGELTRGNLRRSIVHRARINRTRLYWEDRELFENLLFLELRRYQTRADSRGVQCAIRLNGTSDLPWERSAYWVFSLFPRVQFYDYTKSENRVLTAATDDGDADWPSNYHLTFSYSEKTPPDAVRRVLGVGGNVAVVFGGKALPAVWGDIDTGEGEDGKPWAPWVIDGTESDLRFRDPRGVIVGLLAKGRAKQDRSGFVVWDGGGRG